jgi:hypothetical protein
MRNHYWMVALVTLTVAGCAPPPVTTTTTTTTTTYVAPAPRAPEIVAESPITTSPNPGNCGTPAAPRACPPLPRAPLPYYPGDRR